MRTHARLTAARVKQLMRERKPGLVADGGNLYLQDGSSWLFKYERAGVRSFMGLGAAHTIGLAEARQKAQDARASLRGGVDPLAARRASRASQKAVMSFREFAEDHITRKAPEWTDGGRSESQWRSSLAAYVYPRFGDKPVGDVGLDDVLGALTSIWTTRAVTAARVRGRIETILDAARSRGLRTGENPARWKGHLENLLPRVTKAHAVRHHAALPYVEMPAFMAEVRQCGDIRSAALEFTIVTAVRSGEALGARWDEIDVGQRLWEIPAERMKSGRPHRVPLAGRALEIIEAMSVVRQGDYLFPGLKPNRPLGAAGLLTALHDVGRGDLTVHGFRSSFRDWAGDNGVARELAETALAHASGDETERAYRRGDALERRRTLMDAWASHCDGPAADGRVVRFRPTA
jgi:integrase